MWLLHKLSSSVERSGFVKSRNLLSFQTHACAHTPSLGFKVKCSLLGHTGAKTPWATSIWTPCVYASGYWHSLHSCVITYSLIWWDPRFFSPKQDGCIANSYSVFCVLTVWPMSVLQENTALILVWTALSTISFLGCLSWWCHKY